MGGPYNSFLDLAKERFSLRRFSDRPVEDPVLLRCAEAARLAPSACNGQPWRMFMANRKEVTEPLGDVAFGGTYGMNSFAQKAPALVVVASSPLPWTARIGQFIGGVPFAPCDAAVATEHFVLQAQSEGLGSCWIGFFNFNGVARFLNLDRGLRPLFILALGYPPEGLTPPKRSRKPLEDLAKLL
ncbi:nitroreductase [Thermanaerovibrio velox DSM 12556]|uniref:Nitroreductase n=1 Tax=Thermanaerovibrio velox DSM 12556 TaxID=926567 RepID=H0UQ66_9BACT|nr:nitroreductase family protein [Thermanaerovibrio velox]EHM10704.1 nitroreductase [Thermanaerovibrio velox DSM 12556]